MTDAALVVLVAFAVWWVCEIREAADDHFRNPIPPAVERECSRPGCHRPVGHSGRHD